MFRQALVLMLLCGSAFAADTDTTLSVAPMTTDDVMVKLTHARDVVNKQIAVNQQIIDDLRAAEDAHKKFIVQLPVPTLPTPAVATITVTPAPPTPPTVPLDLTNILLAVISGVVTILGIVISAVLNNRMKDKQAAATLSNAIMNSLGAGEAALRGQVIAVGPKVTLPAGVPASLLPNIQYVMDHAGDEAARFGITPTAIASKILAQQGSADRAKQAAISVAQATYAPVVRLPPQPGPVPVIPPQPAQPPYDRVVPSPLPGAA